MDCYHYEMDSIQHAFAADDDVYNELGVRVNSGKLHVSIASTNDIDGDDWLKNIPRGTLVAMQGRHGTLEEFDKRYPLRKTYFLDEVELEDPETEYERFMKIGVK